MPSVLSLRSRLSAGLAPLLAAALIGAVVIGGAESARAADSHPLKEFSHLSPAELEQKEKAAIDKMEQVLNALRETDKVTVTMMRDSMEQALAAYKEAPTEESSRITALGMTTIYAVTGDLPRAIEFQKATLGHSARAFGKDSQTFMEDLFVLARLHRESGDQETYEMLLSSAYKIMRKIGEKNSRDGFTEESKGTRHKDTGFFLPRPQSPWYSMSPRIIGPDKEVVAYFGHTNNEPAPPRCKVTAILRYEKDWPKGSSQNYARMTYAALDATGRENTLLRNREQPLKTRTGTRNAWMYEYSRPDPEVGTYNFVLCLAWSRGHFTAMMTSRLEDENYCRKETISFLEQFEFPE